MKKHNFSAGPSILSEYTIKMQQQLLKISQVQGYRFLKYLIEVKNLLQ